MKIKILTLVGVLALGLLMVNATDVIAADLTDTVGASATLETAYTLNVQAKNVDDDSNAAAIAFGNVTTGSFVDAPQYLEIGYASNEAAWSINIYTDNDADYTGTGWCGGLIGNTHTDRAIGLLCGTYDSVQAGVDYTTWTDNWISDIADALTYGDLLIICYGSPTESRLGGKPTGAVLCTTPIYLYLGADFSGFPADTYSTTLIIDLYHV